MKKRGIPNQTLFYIALAVIILGAIGYYLQFYTNLNFSPSSEEEGDEGVGDEPLNIYECPSINSEPVYEEAGYSAIVGDRCYESSQQNIEPMFRRSCRNIVCIDSSRTSWGEHGWEYEPTQNQIEIVKQLALEKCENKAGSIVSSAVCRGPCLPPGIIRPPCVANYLGRYAYPAYFNPPPGFGEPYYRCELRLIAVAQTEVLIACNVL